MPERGGLPLADRRQVAKGLREAGWSLRRIAKALGVSHEVVRDDLRAVGAPTPARVTGTDGRQFPTRRPDSRPVGAGVDQGALTGRLVPGATGASQADAPDTRPGPRPTPAAIPRGGMQIGGGRAARRGRQRPPVAPAAPTNRAASGPWRPPPGRTGVLVGPNTPGTAERPSAAGGGPSRRRAWVPGLADTAAVLAQHGLDPGRHAAPEDGPLDPQGGPVCPGCGRQHPTPAARQTPLGRLLFPTVVVDPRQGGAAPQGWGRRR